MNNYDVELNKGMKVFSQLYVGLSERTRFPLKEKIVLGFATPYEDNAAGRKRKATVDNWAGGQTWDNDAKKYVTVKPNTKIFDNIPRSGFKITDDVKRVYWGGGNVVWRVLDPYGFELEIQSANLFAIIQTCGINSGGEIPGKCIWGRDNANNILLHESSQEYKNAILAAEKLSPVKLAKASDRNIGSKYLLRNALECIYLGPVFVTTSTSMHTPRDEAVGIEAAGLIYNANEKITKLHQDAEKYDAIEYDIGTGPKILLYKKAPLVKVLEELPELTREELLEKLSDTKRADFATPKGNTVEFLSLEKPVNVQFKLSPLSERQFENIVNLVKAEEKRRKVYSNNASVSSIFEYYALYDARLVFMMNNQLFSNYTRLPHRPNADVHSTDYINVLAPFKIADDGKSTHAKVVIFSRFNTRAKTYNSAQFEDNLKAHVLDSFDDAEAWLTELHNTGKLFQIVAQDVGE